VPKSLLVEKSKYFKKYFEILCRGEWKEATSRVIKLRDIDAKAFKSYVYWIYRNELAIDTDYDVQVTDCDEDAVDHIYTLVKLWLLGDRFADCKLRNAVMDAITKVTKEFDFENESEAFPAPMTFRIWSSLTKGRALRRLVLDHYIERVDPGEIEQDLEEFHPDFVKSLAMSSLQCGSWEGQNTDMCHMHAYYEHDDEDTEGKESKDAASKTDSVK